jgi:signal transduction histidine kinase
MHSLQLVSNNQQKIQPSKQKILDNARVVAMESMLSGEPLDKSVQRLTLALDKILECSLCQVLLHTKQAPHFKPLGHAAVHFNPFITKAIEEYFCVKHITAQNHDLNKEMVISADVNLTETWPSILQHSEMQEIRANWTLPLVSTGGVAVGLVSVFFNKVKSPTNEDLAILQQAGRTIAALIVHSKSKTQELTKRVKLHQQLTTKQNELDETHSVLKKALAQRSEVQSQVIELENMASLGTMMSSLTHEMNTPIGISITAASYLADLQHTALIKLQNEQLKKSELETYFQDSAEASKIIVRNLSRAEELIKTFKQLSVDQHSQDLRTFNLCDYVFEVLLTLKPHLKASRHRFCIDIHSELIIVSNPGALSQILINLIMNSVQHAFPHGVRGRITIKARIHEAGGQRHLQLDYMDNGIGMSESTIENIYKPFFTLARETGGTGLGMHICNNIVMKVLRGNIDCISALGKGVHFSINFPLK